MQIQELSVAGIDDDCSQIPLFSKDPRDKNLINDADLMIFFIQDPAGSLLADEFAN